MTEEATLPIEQNGDDLLWRQLKTIPAFRALLRSVEARFYSAVDLPAPTLDVGCGDGHFAGVTFEEPITAGIDPWWGPLQKARDGQKYDLPLQALGDYLPFPDHAFASAFSNSVLEHIPDIQPVLNEVGRVLRPGAPFVLTVPSHYFTEFLGGAGLFEGLGLQSLAGSYRNFFNYISRHAHTDPPEVWNDRLALAGFTVERWQYYFSQQALRALEVGHAQGVPSAVLHALTGHWIIGPWQSNLRRTEQWLRPYYDEEFPEKGAYLYFLARRKADGPIDAALPPARPYELAALQQAVTPTTLDAEGDNRAEVEEAGPEPEPAAANELDSDELKEVQPAVTNRLRYLIPGLLVALTLLFAYMGQSALRAAPQEPAEGIRWFIFSAVGLLLLLWFEREREEGSDRTWHWSNLFDLPQQRWLYFPALFLSFGAARLAFSPGYLNPVVPLMVWVAAIALGAFALEYGESRQIENPAEADRAARMSTIKISVLLFLAALLVRTYDLANHPFILNGTEASLGLEALNVLSGAQNNPFGTGWLTNPTLPFFFLAIPIRLLGPSALSLRLLSALVGAITVPVLFVIGQRLYGRGIGLAAAILLAGSHYHIHFSRSGLTNAWDALLILLALGLIAIAWQQDSRHSRNTWLLAGSAVGLSAYLYTSSHLLPIMLFLLGIILIIFDSATLKNQWRHIISLAAMAFLIALPQILYYQSSPGVFMERANTLGILANQSGWLNQEVANTGLTQLQLLSTQFWRAALAFNATTDTSTSYGPLVPFLDFVFGLLAALGVILALFRLRQIRYGILVVWIAVMIIFAGALLLDPPNSHRLIAAMPAVSLLAATALGALARAFTKPARQYSEEGSARSITAYLLILVMVSLAIGVHDIRFYFGTYRHENAFGDRNTEIADGIAHYLNSLEGDWVAQFFGPPNMYVSFPTIPFLATDFEEDVTLFDVPEGSIPLHDQSAAKQTYLFLPERYQEIEQLRAIHPAGKEQTFSGYYADPLFYVYEVSGSPQK
ncbi:MAG: glycosyltransferase family 39 protein [Candidatus Promineifilaceae bacterium]